MAGNAPNTDLFAKIIKKLQLNYLKVIYETIKILIS